MTIAPAAVVQLARAIARYVRARRAKRRHDVVAVPAGERITEPLPDKPTERE